LTRSFGPNVKRSTHIDRHVGSRLRLARLSRSISQCHLAERLGLTFQQIQKYERGTNRVSAGRLYEISRAVDVEVTFFFEGLDKAGATAPLPRGEDEASVLFQTLSGIKDRKVRRRLTELITVISKADDDGDGEGEGEGDDRGGDPEADTDESTR